MEPMNDVSPSYSSVAFDFGDGGSVADSQRRVQSFDKAAFATFTAASSSRLQRAHRGLRRTLQSRVLAALRMLDARIVAATFVRGGVCVKALALDLAALRDAVGVSDLPLCTLDCLRCGLEARRHMNQFAEDTGLMVVLIPFRPT